MKRIIQQPFLDRHLTLNALGKIQEACTDIDELLEEYGSLGMPIAGGKHDYQAGLQGHGYGYAVTAEEQMLVNCLEYIVRHGNQEDREEVADIFAEMFVLAMRAIVRMGKKFLEG